MGIQLPLKRATAPTFRPMSTVARLSLISAAVELLLGFVVVWFSIETDRQPFNVLFCRTT